MFASCKIEPNGKDDGGAVDQHVPIHRRGHDRGGEREKRKDESHKEKDDGDGIDPHAMLAQAPARVGKGFASVALEYQAGEGDDV